MNGKPAARRVAAAFAAAAASYEQHADVQRCAAARLTQMLVAASLPPRPQVLEIGCGTGCFTRLLTTRLPGARFVISDIAAAMVSACRASLAPSDARGAAFVVMDGARPALRGPFDLICANMTAQWFADLAAAVADLTALLAPRGVLALSLTGADSFHAWRAAHERLGLRPGAPPLPDLQQCRAAFGAVGGELQLCAEQYQQRFAAALDFPRSLRGVGAATAAADHQPLTAAQMRRLLRALGPQPLINYQLIYALWRNDG